MESCYECEKDAIGHCNLCEQAICSQECMDKHNVTIGGRLSGELIEPDE